MTNIAVGLDEWVVARRLAATPAEGAPIFKTFMEKQALRAANQPIPTNSHISGARLITSGLSGCIAVGLIGTTHFGLAHVFSGCDAENWIQYRQGLSNFLAQMGVMESCIIGYSDDVDKRQPVYTLIEGWIASISPRIPEYRNVGGGMKMTPEEGRVSVIAKDAFSATDIERASAPSAAPIFVFASGNLI